jgi:O-antigen ligase/cytochrome c-type biogenesis protein CcmH/NrfG
MRSRDSVVWLPAKGSVSPGAENDDFDSSALRRGLVLLVALKVAGLILLFDPTGADPFLGKTVFSQGTAILIAGVLALTVFRFGRAVIPPTRVHLFVLAFAVATIISMLAADSSYVATVGEQDRYLGLTFVADMVILYGAIAVSFRRTADWRTLALAIAIATLVSVGYADLQHLGFDPLRPAIGPRRTSGTFPDPDALGHVLTLLFGGALGVAAFLDPRERLPRAAAATLAIVTLAAAVLLATRGSLLGFLAAVLVAAAIAAKLRGADRTSIDAFLLRALVAVTLLTGIVTVAPPLAERVRAAVQGVSFADRSVVYESALAAFAGRPILGHGPDNFGVASPRYRQTAGPTTPAIASASSAYSWPAQLLATLGLIGLIAWLLLIAMAARSLWIRGLAKAPSVAVPVLLASAAYVVHGVVAVDSVAVDWWPWVAFAAAAVIDGLPNERILPVRRIPPLAAFAVVGAAVIAALFGTATLRSNHDAQTSNIAREAGKAETAVAAAQASVNEDPGRARHWEALGLAHELAGDWRAASNAYAEAARRAPYDSTYWSSLAMSRARQLLSGDETGGGAQAALDAARRAVEADPNSPVANAVVADIANLTGDYDLALQAAARAARLSPGEPGCEELAVAAALAVSDPHVGVRALDELLALHESATFRVGLAKLALELKDRDGARRQASRALELDPQNRDARAILDQIGG